ncbi:MAG: cation:proton antiporter [Cyanobacteriota bacterium]
MVSNLPLAVIDIVQSWVFAGLSVPPAFATVASASWPGVLSTVLLDGSLIILVSKVLGGLITRFGQPPVIGEIIGGILLGPSLLGLIAPAAESFLFPPAVLHQLDLLSQLGLILFMLLIGMEVQPDHLRSRMPLATRISLIGILLPLVLGSLLAEGFHRSLPALLPGQHPFAGHLFLGTAMAITAFPVLARILKDRGLLRLPLGQLVITCAAIDDLLSWVLLAAVVSLSRSSTVAGALPALGFTSLWAVVVLVGLRPAMAWMERDYRFHRQLRPIVLACVFAGAILSAVVTELTGVHYIFGAFLFGLAIPRYGPLMRKLQLHTEQLVLTVFLPIFFATSGLKTSIGMVNAPLLWLALLAVMLVAIGGKFLGTSMMAALGGLNARDSQAVGWLMNTRGLTELVILNVGLGLGVISQTLFTLMMLMALITTAMAGPLLDRLGYGTAAPDGRPV